tara:strand:+ start:499 stop:1041 length:543 start_codon:yes stop_codon:yes gene_type:complete
MIGYIYYILDLTNADMYIGSCWKHQWNERIRHHRCKNNNCSSKQIIDNKKFIFEIFEENEFENLSDRLQKEQEYMNNNININLHYAYGKDPIKTEKQLERKKPRNRERAKEHYYNNREQKLQYIKEYSEINKEKIKNYKDDYYKKNKDRLNQEGRQKINCPICNKEMNKTSLSRHIKNKH